MKYIKRFSKVSDYEAFKGGGEYITPNISLIDDGKRVYSEKKVNNEDNLITFTVDGIEYQAEEGMTWKEWANSSYNTGGFIFHYSDARHALYNSDYTKYVLNGLSLDTLVTIGEYSLKIVIWPVFK
jgi:hypothetical protein